MAFSITVGGTSVDGLIEVDYGDAETDELGTAEIQAKNSATNRGFSYGDEVVIQRDGETDWTGYLESKIPVGDRNLKVNLKARDKRAELQNVEVHRPFHNTDSGEAVREAVGNKVQPLSPVSIFDGDTLSGWDADVPEFELADIPAQNLNERGSDLLFLYWGEGASGTYTLTYSNVPARINNGRLLWFEDRFMFNNGGGFFEGEVELRDHAGNSYVWDMGIPDGREMRDRRYPSEEADPSGDLSTNGRLEYRIDIGGALPEARAAVLDYARARPFGTTSRDTELTTNGVQTTGRPITRRFDSSIFEMIAKLALEDGAVSFIDADDDLHYEPEGSEDAPESISYTSTRVSEVDPNRDAGDITNQVVVQGAGDLQVQLRSSASIGFYGISARERPLVEKDIQNEGELVDFGEGYLNEEAWNDTDITFTIADATYRTVGVGQSMLVEWPPEDLNQFMTVTKVETDSVGRIKISLTGTAA